LTKKQIVFEKRQKKIQKQYNEREEDLTMREKKKKTQTIREKKTKKKTYEKRQ